MKHFVLLILSVILILGCVACGSSSDKTTADKRRVDISDNSEKTNHKTSEKGASNMIMKIDDRTVDVEWEDNESVTALKELAAQETITISMSMYGGFEQVGSLGTSLPRNDEQMKTEGGDIVLYSGSNLVVFYGSNSWTYTKLGRIVGMSNAELADSLGKGDVVITISVE